MEGTPNQYYYTSNSYASRLPFHLRQAPFAYAAPSPAPPPGPMSISLKTRKSPPPPLPPPRHVEELNAGQDSGWQFANRQNSREGFTNSPISVVKPGSSLLGGQQMKQGKSYTGPERRVDIEQPGYMEESPGANLELNQDGSVPDLQSLIEYNKLQSERHMGQRSLARTSQMYDKHLLSRIGGPHTPPRLINGVPTTAGPEEATSRPQAAFQKLNGQLQPLSMPERRQSSMENSQARWAPGSSPGMSALRSPMSEQEQEHVQFKRQIALARSHRESYEQSAMFGEQEYPQSEDPGMHELNIIDRSPSASDMDQGVRAGQKRRANSPPPESVIDPRLPGASNENWARRAVHINNATRSPQAQRIQNSPGSLSSNASMGPRNGSLASSYGISNPSTSTSYNSERLSPGVYHGHEQARQAQGPLPPSQLSRVMPENSHQQPLAAPPIPQRRTTASGVPRAPGLWICDCCPKKPKKFESEEELRIHEMEKQYICQYCHNRFKNKNEAERHQNSLHLRRHSWSCASLTSFEAAFHPTPTTALNVATASPYGPAYPPAPQTDTCGYCGVEFPNPPEWESRIEHLNRQHKFGECNQSKKFFRADHFRQHLKHSHAGSSGKWTNMLENACMKDEPPPQPMQPMQPMQPLGMGMNMGMGQAPLANLMPSQHLPHLPPGRLSDLRDE